MPSCLRGSDVSLWVDESTFDGNSEIIEFNSLSFGKKETRAQSTGNRGELARFVNQDRLVKRDVVGAIEMPATTALHDLWLTRILGGAEDAGTDVWLPSDTQTAFNVLINQFDDWFEYDGVVVTKASWKGSSGGLVNLTLDLIGLTETQTTGHGSSGTVPTTFDTIDITAQQLRMAEATFAINGAVQECEDFTLTVDNFVTARHANNLDAQCLTTVDRMISVQMRLAAPTTIPSHSLGDGIAAAAAAVTIVLVNDTVSTTFSMPNCVWPQDTPPIPGKGLLDHSLTVEAKKLGGAVPVAELTVTNDNTVGP